MKQDFFRRLKKNLEIDRQTVEIYSILETLPSSLQRNIKNYGILTIMELYVRINPYNPHKRSETRLEAFFFFFKKDLIQ